MSLAFVACPSVAAAAAAAASTQRQQRRATHRFRKSVLTSSSSSSNRRRTTLVRAADSESAAEEVEPDIVTNAPEGLPVEDPEPPTPVSSSVAPPLACPVSLQPLDERGFAKSSGLQYGKVDGKGVQGGGSWVVHHYFHFQLTLPTFTLVHWFIRFSMLDIMGL